MNPHQEIEELLETIDRLGSLLAAEKLHLADLEREQEETGT